MSHFNHCQSTSLAFLFFSVVTIVFFLFTKETIVRKRCSFITVRSKCNRCKKKNQTRSSMDKRKNLNFFLIKSLKSSFVSILRPLQVTSSLCQSTSCRHHESFFESNQIIIYNANTFLRFLYSATASVTWWRVHAIEHKKDFFVFVLFNSFKNIWTSDMAQSKSNTLQLTILIRSLKDFCLLLI